MKFEKSDLLSLGLSVRSYNALRRGGINTIPQLIEAIHNGSINSIRNIGEKSYQDIVNSVLKFFPDVDLNSEKTNITIINQKTEKNHNFHIGSNGFDISNESQEMTSTIESSIGSIDQMIWTKEKKLEASQNELVKTIGLLVGSITTKAERSGLLLIPGFQDCLEQYLTNLVNDSSKTEFQKIKLLVSLRDQTGLKDQIDSLYSNLTEREANLFQKYALENETLESLGKSESVTRERVRQIIGNATRKLIQEMKTQPMAYFYLALELGKNQGESITIDSYKKELDLSGLNKKSGESEKVLDRFLALLLNRNTSGEIKEVPENIALLLERRKTGTSRGEAILATLSKDELRKLRREISYTGGIQKGKLIQNLGISERHLPLIISSLKLTEVVPNWMTYKVPEKNPDTKPLIRAGLLLNQCCGELSTKTFLGGLKRYISRHFSSLSPNPVVLHYLQVNGFKIVNSKVTYSGKIQVDIPKAETSVLEIFKKHGPVVTAQEFYNEFQAKGYSMSMAASKVLPRSPIIKKVGLGNYVLRGTEERLEAHNQSINTDIPISEAAIPETAKEEKEEPIIQDSFMKHGEPVKEIIDNYYRKYIGAREKWDPFTPEELDSYWKTIESDNVHLIDHFSFNGLERLFFNLLKEVELVGDLPIGIRVFNYISAKTRKALILPTDIRKIPPSVFLIGLVFCARYSGSSARNFWTPYVRKMWGVSEVDQSIGLHTRNHFRNIRIDFEEHLGLNFNVETEGELVKPVYQHAIIPSYLQARFSDWVIDHLENFLKTDQTKLRISEKLINEIPSNELRNFFRDRETQETSIRLVEKMIKALTFLNSTTGAEEIDNLFVSQIERNIWKHIYQKIAAQPKTAEKIRKSAPRLQWAWDCERDCQILKLSNLTFEPDEKPDTLFILKNHNLIEPIMEITLNPARFEDGRWTFLDDLVLEVESPKEKQVCIVSDEFDFSKPDLEVEKRIIYKNIIPELPDTSFFELTTARYAERKATINHSGDWIILSKSDIKILDRNNESFLKQGRLSQALVSMGFSHAYRASLELPILLKIGDNEPIIIEEKLPAATNPRLTGDLSVPGLSSKVPPIFRSTNITFDFSLDPNHKSYKNTYLYLSKGKKVETKRLVDLARSGMLIVDGNRNSIKLQGLLSDAGNYSVNLINNLDLYFPSSFYFSVLPSNFAINFDNDQVFTPNNLPEVILSGLDGISFFSERSDVNVESRGSSHKIRWKSIRENSLEITFHWKDMIVPLAWEIERITAWLEGSTGPQRVDATDIAGIRLEVRGKPRQRFQFRMQNSSEEPMNAVLNASGVYSELLSDTQLPAWTESLQQVCSEITIDFRSDAWKFFNYWYSPSINIADVEYKNGLLSYNINQATVLQGNYSVYLENEAAQTQIPVLKNQKTLSASHHQEIELRPGNYRLVISSFDNPIIKSSLFEVTLAESASFLNEFLPDSNEYISAFLCADYLTLKDHRGKYKSAIGLGSIDQIMYVNQISNWFGYREEIYEHDERMFIKLLPAWAITSHPLIFEIIKHERRWYVFPERALLGGKVGAGYLMLNIQGQTSKLPIYWFTRSGRTMSEALIYYPPDGVASKFSEINLDDMYPMYQCTKCGLILNPGGNTYVHFPVSVRDFHLHGSPDKTKNPFTDIVYEKHVDVKISQSDDRTLWQTYLPSSVIKLSQQGSHRGGKNLPGRVIDPYTSDDFSLAVIKERECYILDHQQKEKFSIFLKWIDESLNKIPAIPAWYRLYQAMVDEEEVPDFVPWAYSVALLSRMKSRYPREFTYVLNMLGWDMDEFASNLCPFAQKTPLILEWCTFWAEVFFVHAIS